MERYFQLSHDAPYLGEVHELDELSPEQIQSNYKEVGDLRQKVAIS